MKRNRPLAAVCIAASLPLVFAITARAADIQAELVFPQQKKHTHGSSVVACPNGDLLAAWYHGSGERSANDVVIQGAWLKRGERTWSPVFTMADTPNLPDCNPVLFIDAQRRLWLFWAVVRANRWERSLLKYRVADDYSADGPPKWKWQDVVILKPGEPFVKALEEGFQQLGAYDVVWAEYAPSLARMTVDAAKDPVKRQTGWMTRIHPLQLPTGRILLPLYSDGFVQCLMAISDDGGATWRASRPAVGIGASQPAVVPKKDGTLVAYFRNDGGQPPRVLASLSHDQGESWTVCRPTELPNPGSSVDVIRLADGRWLMAHNNTESGRHRLALSLSADEGVSWQRTHQLEDGKKGCDGFSYPSLIQAPDGRVHVTYSYVTRQGESIKHAALAVDSGSTVTAAKEKAPPNVVLIISDDQGWTDYGFMDHPVIQTPHLDELARRSVVFKRGYVPTPLCRPSLMTLVTGHYAHRHGVTGNDPSPKYADPKSAIYKERRARLISYIDKFDTLPELLAERGYLSHQSGKWWEGSFTHGGFSHGMTRGFPEPGGRHGDDGLKIGREGIRPIRDFVRMAVKQGRPFFLWHAPFLPHTPHNPPQRLLQKYQREGRPLPIARYYAMCAWFDETCGQLVDLIEKEGIRDNTLIVYVTDNGWIQNPTGRGYAPRSKQTPYEGGVRTPIMFSWPARLKPSLRGELVSSIDLAPTILAAAGARIPSELPGLNLLPNLEQGTPIQRDTILGENFAHDIADLTTPEASLLFRWCIEGKWKLVLTYDGEVHRHKSTHPRSEKRPQLFDLSTDPHEKRNVATDHPEVVSRLAKKIAEWYPVEKRKVLTTFE